MVFAVLRERIDDDYEEAKWPHHRAYFRGQIKSPTGLRTQDDPRLGAVGTVANLESDLNGISAENFEARCTLRKFQVMTEICRKFSRYAGQEFHLMPESSS
jgi:hypothetical protein